MKPNCSSATPRTSVTVRIEIASRISAARLSCLAGGSGASCLPCPSVMLRSVAPAREECHHRRGDRVDQRVERREGHITSKACRISRHAAVSSPRDEQAGNCWHAGRTLEGSRFVMLHWTKEDNPHWDADKQAVFGPADLAAVGLHPPDDGSAVADEWWRVTDDSGAVLGYGWLDSEWGDAQI